MLVCIVQGIRQEGLEGWSVLPAVVLWGIAEFWDELNFLHIHLTWFPLGVLVTVRDIANLLLAFVIAGLLLRRLLRTVRRQRLMELEVKQAQEVQRVILPEPIATLPGLAIASEYRPARDALLAAEADLRQRTEDVAAQRPRQPHPPEQVPVRPPASLRRCLPRMR